MDATPSTHPCNLPNCPNPGTLRGASLNPDRTPYFCEAHRQEYYDHNRRMA